MHTYYTSMYRLEVGVQVFESKLKMFSCKEQKPIPRSPGETKPSYRAAYRTPLLEGQRALCGRGGSSLDSHLGTSWLCRSAPLYAPVHSSHLHNQLLASRLFSPRKRTHDPPPSFFLLSVLSYPVYLACGSGICDKNGDGSGCTPGTRMRWLF